MRDWSVRLGWLALATAMTLLVLSSLYLAADAEGLGQRYAPAYPYVFALAAAALVTLTGAILLRLWRLTRELRAGVPGARLTRRLLLILLLLALPPVALVYAFGARFIAATVDTWLTANSAEAMDESLAIGRLYLDQRLVAAEADLARAAGDLGSRTDSELGAALEAALDQSEARQLAIYVDGRLRAIAAADPAFLRPAPPTEDMRLTLAARGRYLDTEQIETEQVEGIAADPNSSASELRLRVLLPLAGTQRGKVLQGLYGLPADYAARLVRVEQSAAALRQAYFLRDALKLAFQLILTLVLLVSVLLAILLAFDVARRVVEPIARLAAANRAVAAGDFKARVPDTRDDELGLLAKSFNRMVADLETARASAQESAAETERQRAFLETVLARLNSGVLVIDADARLRSSNAAAAGLLECPLSDLADQPLASLGAHHATLQGFVDTVLARRADGVREFREELVLARGAGRQLLLLRGARLPDGGLVTVFDDTTEIDRARRDAAWAEVATRLAHEVKNPLTPIQLAAERLRRRVMPKLDSVESEVVDRTTHTIIAQVDALKTMVNAFGDYARAPALQRVALDLNTLVLDVIELYTGDARLRIDTRLAADLPRLEADAGRLRQVLHNLLKNAQEAGAERALVRVEVSTVPLHDNGREWIDLRLRDDGPGLPEGFDASWFEPYRTTKSKGTGLGLAIVRRIAEEHGGLLLAQNHAEGGAELTLRLPL